MGKIFLKIELLTTLKKNCVSRGWKWQNVILKFSLQIDKDTLKTKKIEN